MAKTELISQSKFAKIVNVSQPRINTLIAQGKLSHEGSKVKMPEAYNEFMQLKDDSVKAPELTSKANTSSEYNVAKAKEKTAKAELAEIKVKIEKGKLLPIAEVIKEVQAACQIIRSSLLNLPNKVSPQLQHKTAKEIQIILRNEVNECLDSLNLLKDYNEESHPLENISGSNVHSEA